MPAIIGGGIVIVQVAGSAIVEFGDTLFISPKNVSKTFNGGGSFNTGIFITTFSPVSSTVSLHPNLIDQPIIGTV